MKDLNVKESRVLESVAGNDSVDDFEKMLKSIFSLPYFHFAVFPPLSSVYIAYLLKELYEKDEV